MNVKLLRQVQKDILEEPRRFNLDRWIATDDLRSPCKTTACIAGFAVIRHQMEISGEKFRECSILLNYAPVRQRAADVLGLTYVQCFRLFYLVNWPNGLQASYKKRDGALHRAKVAVKAIDRFIATRGTFKTKRKA